MPILLQCTMMNLLGKSRRKYLMIKSYKKFWQNILNFSGTANRSEYWWPVIINWILAFVLMNLVESLLGHSINDIYNWGDWSIKTSSLIISFVVWIAMLSLRFRRLHDSNHSAWWILIMIVPIIGDIWFIILMLLPSKANNYD